MKLAVLIIEDNAMTRKLVRLTLEGENYEVIEAPDGKTGLEAARERTPDLVLLDLRLPDMKGREVAQALRALPGLSKVPIIAFSGFVPSGEEYRVSEEGFTGFIVKPIEPSRLLHLVKSYLLPHELLVEGQPRGRRILVVDDDPIQLSHTRVSLQHLGYQVTTANDGGEALALARSSLPEVILSDVLMPKIDGFRLCLTVKQDPKLSAIPVVLTSTHYVEGADARFARSVGAAALVTRGPDLSNVIEAIESAAAGKTVGDPLSTNVTGMDDQYYHRIIRQLERQAAMNANLSQQCSLQSAALSVLTATSSALANPTVTTDAIADVFAQCLDAAGISCGAFFLTDRKGLASLETQIGFSDPAREKLKSFFGNLPLLDQWIKGGVPIFIPSSQVPEELGRELSGSGMMRNALLVPLKTRHGPLGAFLLASDSYDLRQQEWLLFSGAVATQMSQAITLTRSVEQIRRSENLYRTIVETAQEGVWLLDLDGTTLFANRKVSEILGYSQVEMTGKSLTDFVPSDEKKARAALVRSGREGPGEQREARYLRKDGSILTALISTNPIRDKNGIVTGLLGMLTDITERKITEEALRLSEEQLRQSQKLEAIGRLAGGVAHDFNNLLAVIGLYAETIGAGLGETDPLSQSVTEIIKAKERGATLTRQLLMFSRKQLVQPRSLDLNTVVSGVEKMLGRLVGEDIEFATCLAPMPVFVRADSGQLEQVLMNLVVNARDAIATHGKVTLSVDRVTINPSAGDPKALAPGPYVRMSVSDTGSGMDEATQARLFEPFFTTKEQGQGTGLGLSTVYGIVQQCQGRITVESQVGKGTVFRIFLREVEASQPEAATKTAVRNGKRAMSVLLVEDEESLRNIVKTVLERKGCTVTCAGDGEEGLEALKKHAGPLDLIITDVVMPRMGGREFIENVKKTRPDVTVLFLSGYTEDTLLKYGISGTGTYFLEKPFSSRSLIDKINEIL